MHEKEPDSINGAVIYVNEQNLGDRTKCAITSNNGSVSITCDWNTHKKEVQ